MSGASNYDDLRLEALKICDFQHDHEIYPGQGANYICPDAWNRALNVREAKAWDEGWHACGRYHELENDGDWGNNPHLSKKW